MSKKIAVLDDFRSLTAIPDDYAGYVVNNGVFASMGTQSPTQKRRRSKTKINHCLSKMKGNRMGGRLLWRKWQSRLKTWKTGVLSLIQTFQHSASEEDVTRAVLVAIQMITTASKMFVDESEFDDEGWTVGRCNWARGGIVRHLWCSFAWEVWWNGNGSLLGRITQTSLHFPGKKNETPWPSKEKPMSAWTSDREEPWGLRLWTQRLQFLSDPHFHNYKQHSSLIGGVNSRLLDISKAVEEAFHKAADLGV